MRKHHGRKERALFQFCLPTTEPEFPYGMVCFVRCSRPEQNLLTIANRCKRHRDQFGVADDTGSGDRSTSGVAENPTYLGRPSAFVVRACVSTAPAPKLRVPLPRRSTILQVAQQRPR